MEKINFKRSTNLNINNKNSFMDYIYKEGVLFQSLNLIRFKTEKCKLDNCQDSNTCNYYHGFYDRRRCLTKYNYDIRLCNNSEKCNLKDSCSNSHNKIEILYHPNFYKKKYCLNFFKNNKCLYGKFCSFAHCDKEIRIKLLHKMNFDNNFFLYYYKTEFCPLGNIKHDKNQCLYAHNFQDFKRRNINLIIPIKCRNWYLNISYSNYKDGCNFSNECKFSHGWKEIYYNPLIYKTIKCEKFDNKCKYKYSCHFFHNEEERLKYKINENDILVKIPKNRMANKKIRKLNYNLLLEKYHKNNN